MFKTWSILFLATCLALQLVASFPQMDTFESFENLSEESPEIEIYQHRQSLQSDGFDDTRGISNEENSGSKELFRKVGSKFLGNAGIKAAHGVGVLKKILKFIKLELAKKIV